MKTFERLWGLFEETKNASYLWEAQAAALEFVQNYGEELIAAIESAKHYREGYISTNERELGKAFDSDLAKLEEKLKQINEEYTTWTTKNI